jgi:hypothetical protein
MSSSSSPYSHPHGSTSSLYTRFGPESRAWALLTSLLRALGLLGLASAQALTVAALAAADYGDDRPLRTYHVLLLLLSVLVLASAALSYIRTRMGDGQSVRLPALLLLVLLSAVQAVGLYALATSAAAAAARAPAAGTDSAAPSAVGVAADKLATGAAAWDMLVYTAILLSSGLARLRGRGGLGGGARDSRSYALAATQDLESDTDAPWGSAGARRSASGRSLGAGATGRRAWTLDVSAGAAHHASAAGAFSAYGDLGLDDDDLDLDFDPHAGDGTGSYGSGRGHGGAYPPSQGTDSESGPAAGGRRSSKWAGFLAAARRYGILGHQQQQQQPGRGRGRAAGAGVGSVPASVAVSPHGSSGSSAGSAGGDKGSRAGVGGSSAATTTAASALSLSSSETDPAEQKGGRPRHARG